MQTFIFPKEGQREGFYWIESPDIASSYGIHPAQYPGKSEKKLQNILLDNVFNESLVELTADVALAHHLKMPLGACIGLHGRMLAAANHKPTMTDVLVHVSLPVVDGLSIQQLLN